MSYHTSRKCKFFFMISNKCGSYLGYVACSVNGLFIFYALVSLALVWGKWPESFLNLPNSPRWRFSTSDGEFGGVALFGLLNCTDVTSLVWRRVCVRDLSRSFSLLFRPSDWSFPSSSVPRGVPPLSII